LRARTHTLGIIYSAAGDSTLWSTMDLSQLPDVSEHLVTADNPARTDLPGMDHARCAALHDYLVHYGWMADGRAPTGLQDHRRTYFTAYGDAAEELRPRLDPSLAAFLDTALVLPREAAAPTLFFWVAGVSNPFFLLRTSDMADLYDEPEDSLVCLYSPNIGEGGELGGGLFYHQPSHRAAVFMNMDDHEAALPVMAHPELWQPLETVLSNFIQLLHVGKITASPQGAPSSAHHKIGPWEWQPYSEGQVAACVEAWDRLCDAVEARRGLTLSPTAIAPATGTAEREPLVPSAALDAALLPERCFVRDFLTRARRPAFRHIAPGLLLPPADAAEFAAAQPFARWLLPDREGEVVPPVCLFAAAPGQPEAAFAGLARGNPFLTDAFLPNGFAARDGTVPPRVPAGVYSEAVDRQDYEVAEEGFRLLLPYGLAGGDFVPYVRNTAPAGARVSDGSFASPGSTAELFQHGYKPFGGDGARPQRLERLFDH
jgi:hypothetical protein